MRRRAATGPDKEITGVDRQKSLAVLQEAVAEVLAIDAGAVVEEATFREDLGADSLDLVEIVLALEDRLGVSLPQQGLKDITTVGEALSWVSDNYQAAP
jgi:Acyl carrier protein